MTAKIIKMCAKHIGDNEDNLYQLTKIKFKCKQCKREYQVKNRDNLTNHYVRSSFVGGTSLSSKDIPDELVEDYKIFMKLKRTLTQMKKDKG